MPRRTFDMLLSSVGVMLTVVLLVAGGLLMWGYTFANSNVEDQLVAQKIFFPAKGPATASPEIGPFINQYAGQQLTTGAQAEAYANHFIGVHLKESAEGRTYAETSTLSRQNPGDEKLAGQVQTLFRGETLRGLLLNAYAFWKLGQIARIASIASFVMAGMMALLSILGFAHLRKASPSEKILAAA